MVRPTTLEASHGGYVLMRHTPLVEEFLRVKVGRKLPGKDFKIETKTQAPSRRHLHGTHRGALRLLLK